MYCVTKVDLPREIGQLVSNLYEKFTEAFDDENLGRHHPETLIWGRSYKRALEIDKHGGFVKLPLHLQRKIPQGLRSYVELDTYFDRQ